MATIDLTEAEIRGLMVEAGIVATAADAALVLAALSAVDEADLLAALGGSIAGGASPEAVAAARNLARQQARKIFTDLTRTEINKISKTIADGLARGLGPREVARNLDAVKGLDSARAARFRKIQDIIEQSNMSAADKARAIDREFNKLLRQRKLAIAKTEMSQAVGDANRAIAESRGQTRKAWITTGDARVDDACAGNEAEGWISIKDAFSSGSQHNPDHPECRCTVTYRTAPPTDAANARVDARAAQTAAAKAAA